MAIIRPKPLIPKTFYRGETFRGRLSIINTDKTPKDLSNADVRWALLTSTGSLAHPTLSVGSGIYFEQGNPALGIVLVTLFDEDTEVLVPALYQQEWYITDNIGDVGIYRGQIWIQEAGLWATA